MKTEQIISPIKTCTEKRKRVDKGGLGERWLLRLAKRVVKFLESAGVQE